MNKQCKACGSNVPEKANFCQVCGRSDFIFNNDSRNQSVYNYHQYNQQNSVHQNWQPPISQKQPKKEKTGLIVGIVAVVLVILAGIGGIAEKVLSERIFQEQGYGDNIGNNNDYSYTDGENNSQEETSDKLYYSKGTFDGSVYLNKWADIKFALPYGFSDADLAAYSTVENANTECGMYFVADDGLIYICYEKLPVFPLYDEEKFLDLTMKSLENNSSGVTYKIPDTYSTAAIGGYTYTKAECEFNNGNGDFFLTCYVRKLDNYMIGIIAMGITQEYNDALVSNITTVK